MLKIENLHVSVAGKPILNGLEPRSTSGRSARHHGAERLRQEHPRLRPRRPARAMRSRPARSRSKAAICWRSRRKSGRTKGCSSDSSIPVEIPGVNNVYLLKAAINAARKHRGLPEVDAFEFLTLVREKMKLMHMEESFLSRGVNEGFSGGEKKRNEILQMLMLEPRLAILDETDSGLDIDALKVVANGVNTLRSPERSIVLVTHYQRLLDYIVPDFVHVLVRGKIARSGDKTLAHELERRGYDWIIEEAA